MMRTSLFIGSAGILVILVAALLVLSSRGRLEAPPPSPKDRAAKNATGEARNTSQRAKGPWGELVIRPIILDPPQHFEGDECSGSVLPWFFEEMTRLKEAKDFLSVDRYDTVRWFAELPDHPAVQSEFGEVAGPGSFLRRGGDETLKSGGIVDDAHRQGP